MALAKDLNFSDELISSGFVMVSKGYISSKRFHYSVCPPINSAVDSLKYYDFLLFGLDFPFLCLGELVKNRDRKGPLPELITAKESDLVDQLSHCLIIFLYGFR